MQKPLSLLTASALLVAGPAFAQVQGQAAPEDVRAKALAKDERPDGWNFKLKLGITGSFLQSDSVVGQEPGVTLQLGTIIEAGADLKSGPHGWENALTFRLGFTKTPQIRPVVKSLDDLVFQSTYTFNFDDPDWLGPFVRFRLNTSMLPGYVVRATDVTVRRIPTEGDPTTETLASNTRLSLNGAFEPLVLRESLGAFANPIESEALVLKAKLGLGAQQVIGRNGFVLADVPTTPELEILQVRNSVDIGAEAEVAMTGVIVKDTLNWKLSANAFQPFTTPAAATAKNLSGIELMNVEVNGGISLKLSKSIGVEYVLLLRRQPLVIDALQIQNGLLLSAAWDF